MSILIRVSCNGPRCRARNSNSTGFLGRGGGSVFPRGWTRRRGTDGWGRRLREDFCPACTKKRADARRALTPRRCRYCQSVTHYGDRCPENPGRRR